MGRAALAGKRLSGIFMANSLQIIFLAAIFLSLLSPLLFSDLITPNTHHVSRCIKIINVNDFPEIYLIGKAYGPMAEDDKPYIIEQNKCLSVGYKFQDLKIYWAKRDYVNLVGALGSSSLENNSNFHFLETVSPAGYYVPDSSPITHEDISYALKKNPDGSFALAQSSLLPSGSGIASILLGFLFAAILTIIIEVAVLFAIIRRWLKIKKGLISDLKLILAGIFASALTLPFAWFVLPIIFVLIPVPFLPTLFIELIVIVAEAAIYYFVLKLSVKNALIASAICNICSFILGLIIFAL